MSRIRLSVTGEHTVHILLLPVCERRQGSGLLIILLKNSVKDRRTRLPASLSSVSIPGCFSSRPRSKACGSFAGTGESGCTASPQHSPARVGLAKQLRASTVYQAVLACGTSVGSHKNFISQYDG